MFVFTVYNGTESDTERQRIMINGYEQIDKQRERERSEEEGYLGHNVNLKKEVTERERE